MKLTDTQLVVLKNASQRANHLALPLPANLKGRAANKVVILAMQKGLLEEVDANVRTGEAIWCVTGSGHGVTLVITEAGLAAIGIAPASAKPKPKGAPKAVASKTPANGATGGHGREYSEGREEQTSKTALIMFPRFPTYAGLPRAIELPDQEGEIIASVTLARGFKRVRQLVPWDLRPIVVNAMQILV
jgi:hypothetical protein